MNPAIEYLIRRNPEQFLTLPCSLFLENIKKDTRLIVVLLPHYGQDLVVVRHYLPAKTDKQAMLPPMTERIVSPKEVFTHSEVIIPKFKILEFEESPYNGSEIIQTSDAEGVIQEHAYQECLNNFYFPKNTKRTRECWLWQSFNDIYATDELKNLYRQNYCNNFMTERDVVRAYAKSVWITWECWVKHLLHDTGVAPELVFAKAYQGKDRQTIRDEWQKVGTYPTYVAGPFHPNPLSDAARQAWSQPSPFEIARPRFIAKKKKKKKHR